MGMYATLSQITADDLNDIRSTGKRASARGPRSSKGTQSPGAGGHLRLFDPTAPRQPATPSAAASLPAPPSVSLEKMWQGLHFLLTGDAWAGAPPLGLAILGGGPLNARDDESPRVVTPDEVQNVAAALAAITHAELDTRFDPDEFEAADIYPGVWDEDRDELFEELMHYFDSLVSFYKDAAARRNGVLIDIG